MSQGKNRSNSNSSSSPASLSSSSSSSSITTAGQKRKRPKNNSRGVVAKGGNDDSNSDEESTAPHEVVFFGDSLTHGMSHDRADRYAKPWPRMLREKLRKYELDVVECAMCSRTTRFDDINLDNSDWLPNAKPEYSLESIPQFSSTLGSTIPQPIISNQPVPLVIR